MLCWALSTWSVEFRRYRNVNKENCKYLQQQTIYLAETFFQSNLLQSSLISLSIVRSPPNTLHKAETKICALQPLGVTQKIAILLPTVCKPQTDIKIFLSLLQTVRICCTDLWKEYFSFVHYTNIHFRQK